MSILDDAIRQHLDLKRKHGASEEELRELEGQAFGPPARPGEEDEAAPAGPAAEIFDSASEAPTQFLGDAATPEAADLGSSALAAGPADLDETSIVEREPEEPAAPEEPAEPLATESAGALAAEPLGADDDPFEIPPYRVEDNEEQHQAMEHEVAAPEPEAAGDDPDPEPQPGLSAAEREEIAAQPTQLYDFESDEVVETTSVAPAPEAPEDDGPPAEELLAEDAATEAPAPAGDPDPIEDRDAADLEPAEDETGEEAFFDEQSLSDELDQALDLPPGSAEADPPAPAPEPESPARGDEREDLLEGTPDFLQDTPEGERLWFEQRPPKDFDFDD